MNFIKIGNNVFASVKFAKNISTTAYSIGKSVTKNSEKKEPGISDKGPVEVIEVIVRREPKFFEKRILSDIEVLGTILERISQSENEQLISDISKHRIPEHLEEVSNVVTMYKKRGFQDLTKSEIMELEMIADEVESIYEQTKGLMLVNILSKPDVMRF